MAAPGAKGVGCSERERGRSIASDGKPRHAADPDAPSPAGLLHSYRRCPCGPGRSPRPRPLPAPPAPSLPPLPPIVAATELDVAAEVEVEVEVEEEDVEPTPSGLPLGQLLVGRGLVSEEQLSVALAQQSTSGKRLGNL